ncbi:MAG: hypothetical protein KIS92_01875 [Planctomycetota bacterium]|nr:hypothetical protein [Planctomycetota bacterium]
MAFSLNSSCGRAPFFLALLFAFASALALADTVHLKNGKQMRGEIIEETEDYIVIRVPFGQVKVKQEEIDYVERQTAQEYKVELGRELVTQQRYGLAIDELEKGLKADPKSREISDELARALNAYGRQLIQVRRLEEAQAVYEKLKALDPGSRESAAGLELLAKENRGLDRLISEARKQAASADLDGAIAGYEQVLAYTAQARERVGAEFARCLARRAEGSYRDQKFDASMADLERAFGLDPKLTGPLEPLYAASALSRIVALLNQGQIASAQKYLVRVLAFAPTNPNVLYIAGRVQEALSDVAGAADFYARGLRTRVNHPNAELVADLRGKLEKALNISNGQGARLETKPVDEAAFADAKPGAFESYETDHFTILHHNEELAKEVGRVAEAHFERILATSGLKAAWKERPKIYLHRSQTEYTLATAQPEWTGGVSRFTHTARGIANMQVHSWQTSPRLFKSVLPHELTHLIVNENLPSYESLPRAMHEGFSVLMEPDYRHNYYLNFLRLRFKSQDFIPLADLLKTKDYPRDPEFYYAEGFALVAFVARTKGFDACMKLVKEPAEPGMIEEKILAITGFDSMAKLEADWKEWILKGQ